MKSVCVLFISLVVVSAKPEGDEKRCLRLMHPPTMMCCKSFTMKPKPGNEECFRKPGPPSCDRDICMANKKGFASPDGTIEKESLIKYIEEKYTDNPKLVQQLKDKCVNSNIDKYGPPDFCDLVKLNNCMTYEAVSDCSDWDDKGPCKDIPQLIKDCQKVIENL